MSDASNATGKYVCAFRGRRDSYQVPLALAEAGALEEFITDAYAGPVTEAAARLLPAGLSEKLRSRQQPGIPRDRVTSLWGLTAIERLRHHLGYSPSLTFAKLDRQFSLAAAASARATRGNLYLYSSYAWEAFNARYTHDPKKILFQYHPHPDAERRILAEDRIRYPFVAQSFAEEAGEFLDEEMRQRISNPWQRADRVICASSFTKQSMLEAGAPPELCEVIPYGIDVPDDATDRPAPETFHVLFVGSGSQRKGLHHLLLAWRRAVLPKGSLLTLVCRQIDPGIAALANKTPNVCLITGATGNELVRLYGASTLFAMPSLVEGFGFVYLEALAQGCPVLGTPNTGLPDLGGEADGIWTILPGQIEGLVASLESLARRLPGDKAMRAYARSCAVRWTWPRFRAGIRASLIGGASHCQSVAKAGR
jgi:glycosyltransferase involved in cell wall biosynthesis